MDRDRFDALARLLATSGSRRVTLGALLGVLTGPTAAETARKRRKDRGNDKDNDKDRDRNTGRTEVREREQRLQAERRRKGGNRRKNKKKRRGGPGGQTPPPPDCCGTESCPDPEPGSTSAGCDFAGRAFAGQDHNGSIFRGIDGREAIFTDTDNQGSVFAEACLQGARFRRAKLGGSTWGGACLFGTDFTGADFGGDETLFDEALFCGTVMPDGTVNDRDCGRATACCRAELGGGEPECQSAADCQTFACIAAACTGGQCDYTPVASGPSPNNLCSFCCDSTCCQSPANQCTEFGLCCAPNCAGRQCGPDGCGGSGTCGSCPGGQRCNAAGRCICDEQSCPNGCCDAGGACQPGNANQVCGTGGAPCERCGAGQACLNRQCVACTPNCTGKVCGPDGCGGSCGTCPTGLSCDNGSGRCLCTTASCPDGCCSAGPGNPGACLAGDTDQSCNKGGLRCVACASGSTCGGRGCQPLDCRNLCGSEFCLNLVEGNVACHVPLATVCNNTEPDLTTCTSTAECAARDDVFVLCVASYTDPTTTQTEVLFCGGQPAALCARGD